MSKSASFISVAGILLDRGADLPLHRQLYDKLRQLILAGQLGPGTRLPSTRALSAELGLSRSTVVEAVEQLVAEGYVVGRMGAGTFVSEALPESLLTLSTTALQSREIEGTAEVTLSQRGRQFVQVSRHQGALSGAFTPGIPELATFPFAIWRKLLNKHWRKPTTESLVYGSAAGYPPLREAIADYVRTARGVSCTAEQVIIVAGAQQGIHLTVQLLTDAGDAVWIENPAYSGTQALFQGAGLRMRCVSLDKEGLIVEEGIADCPDARLVYVTPSHQYPVGVTMTLTRRMQLLQWAQEANAWILEDDYDSEFRFAGHPLASLQGLDQSGRVLYIGTFSKVLFPALRLGYLIVPPALRDAFATARAHLDRGSPWIMQMVLNDFIREGHFARHIRRMRTLYAHRQQVLIEAIQEHCGEWLTVNPAPAGLHLVGWLAEGVDDRAVSAMMAEVGIEARALSSYSLQPLKRGGLVLGFAALDEGTIRASVKRMAKAYRLG